MMVWAMAADQPKLVSIQKLEKRLDSGLRESSEVALIVNVPPPFPDTLTVVTIEG